MDICGKIETFPLGDVLTVVTGKLLAAEGMGSVYRILTHMTGESPFTHQLGRFMDECRPWLIRWFPELESPALQVEIGKLTEMLETPSGKENPSALVTSWIAVDVVARGLARDRYDIGQIPRDDHDSIDPFDELVQMRGTDEGIVVIDEAGNISA